MNTPENSTPSSAVGAASLSAGQTIGGGRFLLKKVIGYGGMGVVWLAHDLRLQEPVALKFLPPQLAFDPGALEDLRRETLRSRKLSHPNIVRIHDICVFKDEPPFLSMEYVDGLNLHQVREARPLKVLTWAYLLPLVRQLCAALDYAHSEKVVHRDLKSANLLLDSSGRLKLTDFGLARVAHDSLTRLTGQTMAGGTINFMSPQQADGKPAHPSDDIYSLGATLYDLLTSRPPFHQGDVGYQVCHTRPEPMAQRLAELELANDIPSEVSALVMACLSKEPEGRPANAKAILDFLDAAERRQPATLVTGVAAAPEMAALPPAPDAATPPPSPAPAIPLVPPLVGASGPIYISEAGEPVGPRRSALWPVAVAVAGLLIIGAAGVVGVWLGKRFLERRLAERPPEPPPPVAAPPRSPDNLPVKPAASAVPSSPTPPAWVAAAPGWESCPKLPGERIFHSAVWTGKEMIIWGGGAQGRFLNDGAAYDPVAKRWRLISSQGAPSGRWCHAGFWTGREMIIWGGRSSFPPAANRQDGALYDPATDRWRPINPEGAPAPRSQMAEVWTGEDLIVWGGWTDGDVELADGARYNPATGRWTPLPRAGAPAARMQCLSFWTGQEMLVWGGILGVKNKHAPVPGGARYHIQSDTWRPISTRNAPTPRATPAAVWTGQELLLGGGSSQPANACRDFFRYTPATDSWSLVSNPSPLVGRDTASAVWTGQEMIIWAGNGGANRWLNTGVRYDPARDRWTPLEDEAAPAARGMHTAVWTGTSMLVFGGSTGGWVAQDTVACYTPGPSGQP